MHECLSLLAADELQYKSKLSSELQLYVIMRKGQCCVMVKVFSWIMHVKTFSTLINHIFYIWMALCSLVCNVAYNSLNNRNTKIEEKEGHKRKVVEATNVKEDLKVDDAALYWTTWCSA